jgi:hypothetical protein
MAESSHFWDGSNYASSLLAMMFGDMLAPGQAASAGVLKGVGNHLAVTGSASPIAVNTGAALVNGRYYKNTASVNINVSTPSSATRIDRVVLRVNYSAETITLQLLAGSEGGAAPALTQIDGTTWEISLAQVSITTGGVITLTNERKWCKVRGAFLKGHIMPFSGTFSGHYPVDPDLGTADTDWHLCNGDTEGGVVTPNLADQFVIAAGSTYTAGSSGGAATHTHGIGSYAAANESTHTHSLSGLTIAAESSHTHGYGTLATNNAGSHTHGATTGVYWINESSPSADLSTAGGHTHSVSSGATGAGSSHTHGASGGTIGAGDAHTHTLSGTSASGSTLPPYYALCYICYVGA